ncbi:probable serine/threonine-protein kinase DDB_G0272282 isoform X2 [Octopus sinensis]|uniref:Probable serine/threonine-protein kinase DDB_G0272282 isoform X2 n=1 Tax=Octopus sinensis TaxID=2607531 RepID=A0A6P7SB28_9MOLL|nr:probable serine/threonine-protein kinase DDB_G0272282 isoform X2 [Octopus sinensis]
MNQRVSKVKNFKKKMKINEKSLIHFANSNRSSDKEGYLQKKGELNKSFQRRWFILKGNLLFYYEKKHDKEPMGVVVLEGCTIELAAAHHINSCGSCNNGSSTGNGGATSGESFTFEIVFPRSGARTYVLSSNTQEEMESWMKALTCASYDYLKMMVTELQRQLEEANIEQSERIMGQVWEDSPNFGNTLNSGECSSNSYNNRNKNNLSESLTFDCSSHSSNFREDGLHNIKDSCDPNDSNIIYRYPVGLQNRFNPFNTMDNDNIDIFSSEPNKILNSSHKGTSQSHHSGLASAGSGIQQSIKKSRTFIEMHEEFGKLLK